MDTPTEQPRGLIGDNLPADMLLSADDLLAKFNNPDTGLYLGLSASVTTLLAEINGKVDGVAGVPVKIETETENGIVAAFMERLRSTIKTANNHHDVEKAPYLKAGRTVDQFFSGMTDRLEKAREILQKRGNDYTARKVAEERAERERVARIERDRLAAVAEEERKAREQAEELAAAALRARKPENIAKLETAAAQSHVAAQTLQVDTMIAQQTAENAINATKASSASIARTRFESGHLATAKQVPYIEITDKTKLDFLALLPYIKESVLLSAVTAYARATEYQKPMAGAIIERRDAADYR